MSESIKSLRNNIERAKRFIQESKSDVFTLQEMMAAISVEKKIPKNSVYSLINRLRKRGLLEDKVESVDGFPHYRIIREKQGTVAPRAAVVDAAFTLEQIGEGVYVLIGRLQAELVCLREQNQNILAEQVADRRDAENAKTEAAEATRKADEYREGLSAIIHSLAGRELAPKECHEQLNALLQRMQKVVGGNDLSLFVLLEKILSIREEKIVLKGFFPVR